MLNAENERKKWKLANTVTARMAKINKHFNFYLDIICNYAASLHMEQIFKVFNQQFYMTPS